MNIDDCSAGVAAEPGPDPAPAARRDGPAGLSGAEVAERLAAGLGNTLPRDSSRSLWSILRANVFTLFNGIVGGSFLLLLLVGQWKDALFGFSAVMNAVIGVVQEYRAKRALDRLALLHAPHAIVIRDGERQQIPRERIVRDDLLVLRAGDQLPADGEVLDGDGLGCDESLLTGESEPVAKGPGDAVLSGSTIVAGAGLARVTRVGAHSFAAGLTVQAKRFSLVASEIRSSLDRILRWVAWLLGPVLLLVVNAQMQTVGGWQLAIATGSWRTAIVGAIGAAIAMVPLGLVLMTSVAFVVGAVKLSAQQVLVNELPAVEGLARVDVLCFDKTGTLTDGVIEFDEALPVPGAREGWRRVLGAIAHDPEANASAACLRRAFPDTGPEPDGRIVFSSTRKWSALRYREESGGLRGSWVLGAPDIVLAGTGGRARAVLERARELSAEGRRVLLLATSELPQSDERLRAEALPEGLRPVALLTLHERVREDASETVRYFREQDVSLRVISGDDPRTVSAVAGRIGIPTTGGYDARDLPEDEEEMGRVLDEHTVFGRVTPQQKRAMVRALQRRGHVVAMTGDGVNDILALKDADLGIAMGGGAQAARAVSRIVLLDGRFSHLPHVVAEGRRVIANVERLAMLFLSKTAYSILIALLFGALLWEFPFLPRQLSVLDGITIGLPGFVLALIPNPRRYRPGFLRRALAFAAPAGAIVTACILAVNLAARLLGADPDQARTAGCLTLTLVALWILGSLVRPFGWWQAVMLLICHAALVAVTTAPLVGEFFAFVWPGEALFAWALGIAAAGAAAIAAHARLHRARFAPAA
ncbi:MAG: HAD-IC family P-type ATPase [Pseudoclavibacter sp.]|nr:HAD-IC family P-type ATPase [Pseudoclavibacter sp.]